MTERDKAVELDKEAEQIASRSGKDFIRLGEIMAIMTDPQMPRWALLSNPRTGSNYRSQEEWLSVRFTHNRATALEARTVYQALNTRVPRQVLESAAPGVLRCMAKDLPESAQGDKDVHELAVTKTPAEFIDEMIKRYPNELIEKRVSWLLRPTMSQARMYDDAIEEAQKRYAVIAGSSITREEALEALLADWIQSQPDQTVQEPDWSIFHG